MDKYQMFDAIQKYNNNLSHAQSKLYGTQRNDVKYYKREGKPGNYTYYYTKEEWDAAHKPKTAKLETKMTGSYTSDQAEGQGLQYQQWLDEQKEKRRIQNEYEKNAAGAEQGGNKHEGDVEKTQRQNERNAILNNLANNLDNGNNQAPATPNKVTELSNEREAILNNLANNLDNGNDQKPAKPNSIKEQELKNKDYVKWYKETYQEEIKQNSEELLNNPDSTLNKMGDIITYMNDVDQMVEDYKNGDLFTNLYNNDRIIDDIYQEIAERKETEETDPKTGFKIKNYELPMEEEIKLVNPGYYYSDQDNTEMLLYGMDLNGPSAYANNCYACTQAMALRKQGYDVTAGPDFDGIADNDEELGIKYNNLWTGNFNPPGDDCYYVGKEAIDALKYNKEPAGSYGDFNVVWIDGTGHSMFYEIDKSGKVHYYDCQIGQEVNLNDLKSYIAGARYKRLDNQTYKGKVLKEAGKVSSNMKVGKEGIVDDEKK